MKTCYKCKEKLEVSEFHKNKTRKDGFSTMCKKCSKEYFSTYFRKHKGAWKERGRITRKVIRQFVFDYLKKHPCVDCKEPNPVVLEFDHVRGEKQFNIGHMLRSGYGLETVKLEIAKCDVRCSNCHKIRTAKVRGWYKDLT